VGIQLDVTAFLTSHQYRCTILASQLCLPCTPFEVSWAVCMGPFPLALHQVPGSYI